MAATLNGKPIVQQGTFLLRPGQVLVDSGAALPVTIEVDETAAAAQVNVLIQPTGLAVRLEGFAPGAVIGAVSFNFAVGGRQVTLHAIAQRAVAFPGGDMYTVEYMLFEI